MINSDAHFHDKVGAFRQAEDLLKEIDFPEELVLNANLERFENFLRSRGFKTNAELTAE